MDKQREYPNLLAREVASRCGISETTLWRLMKAGDGPVSYKIGKHRLWRESDVLDWLERECRQESFAASRTVRHAAALAR
jgi:excisionase family DNA binding protein